MCVFQAAESLPVSYFSFLFISFCLQVTFVITVWRAEETPLASTLMPAACAQRAKVCARGISKRWGLPFPLCHLLSSRNLGIKGCFSNREPTEVDSAQPVLDASRWHGFEWLHCVHSRTEKKGSSALDI